MATAKMDLRSVLREIHSALTEARIDHALIGGLALAAHGSGRATVDIDWLADGEQADGVLRILLAHGYACVHRTPDVANFVSDLPSRGRVDFLFARRSHGRAMLERAELHEVLGRSVRVLHPSDLVGLKVQSSSNDPSRRHRDLADIEWLLQHADIELERVRAYFRLFDREKELDALLSAGSAP